MDRRTYLRSLALGSVATVAGCLEGDASGDDSDGSTDGPAASVSTVETTYPQFSASYYSVTASRADEADGETVPFEEIPHRARIEVANGVARDRYVIGESPAVLGEDLHHGAIEYRGTPIGLSVAVADRFQQPEHGPEGDPDWSEPIELDATVSGTALEVTLTNELDRELPIHHYGRPYFGVLVAVGETATTLSHEAYSENEFVETDDPIRTRRVTRAALTTETLSPGDSLAESYGLPETLPDDATVRPSVRGGDDSVDLFGNQQTVLAATLEIEA